MAMSGRVNGEFIEGVLEVLLERTRPGWVTHFKAEWGHGGGVLYVACNSYGGGGLWDYCFDTKANEQI